MQCKGAEMKPLIPPYSPFTKAPFWVRALVGPLALGR